MINPGVVLTFIGTLPSAYDLLASRFASLHHAVALDLLPYMLSIAWVNDKMLPSVSGILDISRYLDELSHGLPIYRAE